MIRSEWLAEASARSRSGSEELALWHLLSVELWHRRHRALGAGSLRRTA